MSKEAQEARTEGESPSPPAAVPASPAGCLHTLSLVVLSLLLPLAFLLLARLTANPLRDLLPFPASTFLRADLLLLSSLLSALCVATLLGVAAKAPTAFAWAFLCVFHLCVGVGVEAAIAAGVEAARGRGDVDVPTATWARRAAFFLGVHEVTLFWVRTFVRPVVDDAFFRAPTCELGRGGKAAIGVAFSLMWLWTLGNEVDGLLSVAVNLGEVPWLAERWCGGALWTVSHATVAAGAIRITKGLFWLGKLLLARARARREGDQVEFSPNSVKSCEV